MTNYKIPKKKVIISLTGVLLSQLFTFIGFAVIAKSLSPEEMGVLNMHLSISMFLGTILGCRYELSGIQNSTRVATQNIYHALLLGFIIFFILLLIIFFINPNNLLIILFAFSFFIIQTFYLYYNTKENYTLISLIKISLGFGFFSISFFSYNFLRIFTSYTFLYFIISIFLFIRFFVQNKKIKINKAFYFKYNKYPLFILPSTLLNSLQNYLLPISLPAIYSNHAGGLFAIAHKIGIFPISLIAQTLSALFRKEIISQPSNKRFDIYKLYGKYLLLVSIIYLFFSNLIFDNLINSFLSSEWSESNDYFRILSPFYALQIIYIPLSQIFIIYNHQKIDLFIQILIGISISFSLLCGFLLKIDIKNVLFLFSVLCSISTILGIFSSYKIAKND